MLANSASGPLAGILNRFLTGYSLSPFRNAANFSRPVAPRVSPSTKAALDLSSGAAFYDGLERFGNVSLLHFTDCHAQLNPVRFREPSVNLGVGAAVGRPPHLVGEALLRHFGIRPGTREAHAFTYLDYEAAARTYGELGGFAHLATLVRKLKETRPGALLLDGGDTWQGSATALWTKGQDMVDAQKALST
jgi:sulfur-oxidizing protein SoxB